MLMLVSAGLLYVNAPHAGPSLPWLWVMFMLQLRFLPPSCWLMTGLSLNKIFVTDHMLFANRPDPGGWGAVIRISGIMLVQISVD